MSSEESVKGWFHAVAGVYLGILLGYNIMKVASARKPRHVANVLIYGFGVYHELRNAKHHWSKGAA